MSDHKPVVGCPAWVQQTGVDDGRRTSFAGGSVGSDPPEHCGGSAARRRLDLPRSRAHELVRWSLQPTGHPQETSTWRGAFRVWVPSPASCPGGATPPPPVDDRSGTSSRAPAQAPCPVHTRPAPAGHRWSAAASSIFASRDRPVVRPPRCALGPHPAGQWRPRRRGDRHQGSQLQPGQGLDLGLHRCHVDPAEEVVEDRHDQDQ